MGDRVDALALVSRELESHVPGANVSIETVSMIATGSS
jgi:hypothetical protein